MPCSSASQPGDRAVCRRMKAPRGHGSGDAGSKHDGGGFDFTPDLRVSRIASAPASIRVSAGRSGDDGGRTTRDIRARTGENLIVSLC